MSNWGGKRPGAGRKPAPPRVQIWPVVLPETVAKLNKTAFDLLITTGEVIDRWAAKYRNKNLVDKPVRKK
jgi:hypothetical protein